MLFLLSPAKSLDYESPVADLPHTQPLFRRDTAELVGCCARRRRRGGFAHGHQRRTSRRSTRRATPVQFPLHGAQFAPGRAGLQWRSPIRSARARTYAGATRLGAGAPGCILSGLYGCAAAARPHAALPARDGHAAGQRAGLVDLYRFGARASASTFNERLVMSATRWWSTWPSQEYFQVRRPMRRGRGWPNACSRNGVARKWKIISFMVKRAWPDGAPRHHAPHRQRSKVEPSTPRAGALAPEASGAGSAGVPPPRHRLTRGVAMSQSITPNCAS